MAQEPYPNDEAVGLLARISNPGLGTANGYAFTYHTGSRDINMDRITNEQPTLLTHTQIVLDPTSLPASQRYRPVFTGTGPELTGAVYLVTVNDETNLFPQLRPISALLQQTRALARPHLFLIRQGTAELAVAMSEHPSIRFPSTQWSLVTESIGRGKRAVPANGGRLARLALPIGRLALPISRMAEVRYGGAWAMLNKGPTWRLKRRP